MAAGEALHTGAGTQHAVRDAGGIQGGGTYLWFFHGLRRFSEDLDFTAIGELDENVIETVARGLGLFGVENEQKPIKRDKNTFSFRIAARGPLNTGAKDLCFVYVEISRREDIIEKCVPIKLDLPAYQIPIKRLSGMSLNEVAAEKVRAVLTRKRARDLYDLNHLIKEKEVRFNRSMAEMKLEYYGRRFLEGEFVDDAESMRRSYRKELEGIVFGDLPSFGSVMESLRKWVH